MQVVTADLLDSEAQYLKLCCYGEPGTGKTWMAASAALDEVSSPVLFIEYRAQIASLRSNPKYLKAIEDERLVILRLGSYEELSHIYTWLFRGSGSKPALDDKFTKHGPPKTVVLDSLTELQRAEVLRRGGNTPGKFIRDVASPEIRDWGSLLNQFTLLAHLYYALPYHVCFFALEAVEHGKHPVGEVPPIVGYRIAMQGAAQRQFPAYALTVMRLERAPRNSKAFTIGYTSGARAKTKEQSGMIPDKIPNPTIPLLVKMLQGGKDA